MITDCDEDRGGGRKKRHRSTVDSKHNVNTGTDCYDEILEGNINGSIRNSWLRNVIKIGSEIIPSAPLQEDTSPISSLSRQLLQVKRRLWPAAERCAGAHNSSPQKEFTEARRVCNPMEPLGEGRHRGLNQMFINRSAIKLANIDVILGFTLTTVPGDHFFFVDLCGAPGGFSEYLMKRCQSTRSGSAGSCRGYGMSLVGDNEHGKGTQWKLEEFCDQHGPFQTQFRRSGGADGTGDLYHWNNVLELSNGIHYDMKYAGLDQQKVHLVTADGGFDAQRDSECQEEISQKLVLCQVAAGLYLLRHGGRLIVKMFGFQTSTVRTVMRSLFDYFEEIIILKPISSRPASSERYVVCTGFQGVPPSWNGPTWMNAVLLGTAPRGDDTYYSNLDKHLDLIDRDMFTLNLKACFAILSCLDRKAATKLGCRDHENIWFSERSQLNVNMYKYAWNLD